MNLKKLLTSGLCAVLTIAAVPLTAFAEDTQPVTILPEAEAADWIPKNFTEALRLRQAHGPVYAEGDLVCCVRMAQLECDAEEPFICDASEGSGQIQNKIYPLELPKEPKKEDYASDDAYWAAYEAYQNAYRELGIYPGESSNQQYYATVSVFRLLPNGSAKIRFTKNATWQYTFEADAEGNVTETDIYGWLPDSYSEYDEYLKKNTMFSVHDNLIVCCLSSNGSTGFQMDLMQQGTAKLELIKISSCSSYQIGPGVAGNSNYFIHVYKPVTEGTVEIIVNHHRAWVTNDEHADIKTSCYEITEESVTPITEEKMEKIAGDCDADGVLSVNDLKMLEHWLLGTGTLADWENADLSKDGTVNAVDLTLLKRELMQTEKFADVTLTATTEYVPHSTVREIPMYAEVKLCDGVQLAEDEELVVMLRYAEKDMVCMMADNGDIREGDMNAGDGIWTCTVPVNTGEIEESHFTAYAAVRKAGGLAQIRACSTVETISVILPPPVLTNGTLQ